MFDIIIRNATIIDGTGNPRYYADVAVKGKKIQRISKALRDKAFVEIDGTGRFLTPGFIDTHCHQDFCMEKNYACNHALEQGITTLIGGMCGDSPMPISHDQLAGCLREVGVDHSPESRDARFDTKKYLDFIDQPMGVNAAYLVGHGTLRACVVGYADRKLTAEEQSSMETLLRRAMEAGCYGLSFGLIYPPGCYADMEEMIGLAKVVAEYGGVITVHMRSEGERMVEAVDEMMQVTRASNVRMIISHHKAASGPMCWNKTAATLSIMNHMVDEGYDVFCDQYPYTANSTGLKSLIPQDIHALGIDKMLELVSTSEGREMLRGRMCPNGSRERYRFLMIGHSDSHRDYDGRMVNEIADSLGMDPFDVVCDVLRDDKLDARAIFHTMCEEDVERVMRWPRAMVGSDGSYYPGIGGVHPRTFGTFPRYLGRYVREKQIITWEEAIRKMCYLPTMVYNFPTKGIIREGMDADIVLFDPKTICDHADYVNPQAGNSGIDYVIVAGKIAVHNGKVTGVLAGRQLRKQAK